MNVQRKVGDPVWHRESHTRKWQEYRVIGETRVSWLVSKYPDAKPDDWSVLKIAKRKTLRDWAWSEAEIEDRRWEECVKWKLANFISQAAIKGDTVREVARLVGYTETGK